MIKEQLPIIFLDFDGVLNSDLFYKELKSLGFKRESVEDDLDSQSISFLNTLIKETNAKVVVTSVWRLNRTVQQLQTLLEKKGFVGEVIGKTDSMSAAGCLRGNEIFEWIKNNINKLGADNYSDYDRYVIFDDDSDMLYWQRNNFLIVDSYCGLTPNRCYKARKILNGTYKKID
jgi:hypothetical protein